MEYMLFLFLTVGCWNIGLFHWGYSGINNENHWPPECYKDSQSPIDIDTKDIQYLSLGSLNLQGYHGKKKEKVVFVNNGHSLQLEFPEINANIHVPYIKSNLRIVNIHFHWGGISSMGSEHTVNKKRYSMEMHAVHQHKETGDIVVIARLFTSTVEQNAGDNNTVLTAIMENIDYVRTEGKKHIATMNMDHSSIQQLFLTDKKLQMHEFCTYVGSFTTPPCTQGVIWIIHNKIVPVSENLLEKLRSLKRKKVCKFGKSCQRRLVDNFRATKLLKGRSVSCNAPWIHKL